MSKELIEKVRSSLSSAFMDGNITRDGEDRLVRSAILAVLEFYSEPINITEDMMYAVHDNVSDNEGRVVEKTICVAMRAARDEVSRGK